MYGENWRRAQQMMNECDYRYFWQLVRGINSQDKAKFARDFLLRHFPVMETGVFDADELMQLLDAIRKLEDGICTEEL